MDKAELKLSLIDSHSEIGNKFVLIMAKKFIHKISLNSSHSSSSFYLGKLKHLHSNPNAKCE
jgi:hypothetical protein